MSGKEFRAFEMRASLTDDNDVERDADGVPVAFRLWRAGKTVTDYGESWFTKESAALLLEEQATRGNRYSIDVNHMSLKADAPLENQRAVGSFAIAVRNGECWAVDARWTAATREQHIRGEWLSISPAYDQRTSDDVICGLTNCALTGTPATHGATRLAAARMTIAASRGGSARMTGGGAASMPVDLLRIVAGCDDRDLRIKASRELSRRGEPQLDPESRDGQRMAAAMRPYVGGGAATVKHEGKTSTFEVMTREDARHHIKRMNGR